MTQDGLDRLDAAAHGDEIRRKEAAEIVHSEFLSRPKSLAAQHTALTNELTEVDTGQAAIVAEHKKVQTGSVRTEQVIAIQRGEKIWVITEADRSSTFILPAEEYRWMGLWSGHIAAERYNPNETALKTGASC